MRITAALTAAIAVALIGAAHGQAAPPGTASVPSALETTGSGNDEADDPAIWVNQADPAESLVIGNQKTSRRLTVYNLAGQEVQQFNDGAFYGNVDVRDNWVVASHSGIAVFRVVNSRLVPSKEATGNTQTAGEGLCLWQSAGNLYAINVVRSSGRVRVHPLTDNDGDGLLAIGQPIKQWTQPSESEACVVDDSTGYLYMSEEDRGIWRVNLNSPGQNPARTLFIPLSSNLSSDAEGLTIVGNQLYASAQNVASPRANWIARFDLASGTWLGNFRVTGSASSDDCDQTDGIATYTGYLNSTFPNGLLVCQDGYNETPSSGPDNFKYAQLP